MKRTSRTAARAASSDDLMMSVTGTRDYFKIALTLSPTVGGGSGMITAGVVDDDDEDERLFTVYEIAVKPRRRGIGTMLWEAAAAEAERRGGRLASSVRISREAEAFWEKQAAKGRVEIRPGGEGTKGAAPIYVLRRGVRDLKNNPRRKFEPEDRVALIGHPKFLGTVREYSDSRPRSPRVLWDANANQEFPDVTFENVRNLVLVHQGSRRRSR